MSVHHHGARVSTAEHRALVSRGMSEKSLQDSVMDLARALGWRAYHTHDSRRSPAGFPDLVLVHPRQGRLLFRELKTMRGRVTPDQEAWLADLIAAGQDAAVWRPSDLLDWTIFDTLRGVS